MSNEFIEEYNEFLSGEISAVETYDLALKNAIQADVKDALLKCRDSHADRVAKLAARVANLGGKPVDGAGVWGSFATFIQKSAGNERDAIALLEQSEAERLVRFEAQQHIVVSPVLDFLKDELLPAQHVTHLTMSALLKSMLPLAS
ncbi:MAG TPA: DUF2383 domain-containing protein [Chroococcales cyanobacterium]